MARMEKELNLETLLSSLDVICMPKIAKISHDFVWQDSSYPVFWIFRNVFAFESSKKFIFQPAMT